MKKLGLIALGLAWSTSTNAGECSLREVEGAYVLDGSPPIELTLTADGEGTMTTGMSSARQSLKWEMDAQSGNLFITIPSSTASLLRKRASLRSESRSPSGAEHFGLEPECTLLNKRLYVNRDPSVYFSTR